MNEALFDIAEESASSSDTMKRLVAMAAEAVATEQLIADLEENLSEVKKRFNRLKTVELPDLMAECGMSSLKMETGQTISIEDFVSGSLPKDDEKRAAAIEWLESHEAESLIKTEVNLTFDKSEHNLSMSLVAELAERGFAVTSKSGVHASTLVAHVKERLRKGDEVPLELLGLYAGRTAKIKVGRKK